MEVELMTQADLVVIGGGPAGMAAAIEAYKNGINDVLIIEREKKLGGILRQCIHNGFGLHIFGEELTGPEYAERFKEEVENLGIKSKVDTMVLDINENKEITYINSVDGLTKIKAKAIILAMGCRERTRGALNIPGTRPAGIFTAGTAQRYVNIEGYLPGRKVFILGSGDIGLIMARRLTLEGARVVMVCEILPYPGGLKRNIVQCLDDFDIPLVLSHTVVKIHGNKRVTGVTMAEVDSERRPVPGTEKFVECDTVLLSVGLIPENELSLSAGVKLDPLTNGPIVDNFMRTSVEGIYACGNVLHVNDLVDNVTEESRRAGKYAAGWLLQKHNHDNAYDVKISPGAGIRYVVPHIVRCPVKDDVVVHFRVNGIYENINIVVESEAEVALKKRRPRVVPGEMESVTLKRDFFSGREDLKEIRIRVEKC